MMHITTQLVRTLLIVFQFPNNVHCRVKPPSIFICILNRVNQKVMIFMLVKFTMTIRVCSGSLLYMLWDEILSIRLQDLMQIDMRFVVRMMFAIGDSMQTRSPLQRNCSWWKYMIIIMFALWYMKKMKITSKRVVGWLIMS